MVVVVEEEVIDGMSGTIKIRNGCNRFKLHHHVCFTYLGAARHFFFRVATLVAVSCATVVGVAVQICVFCCCAAVGVLVYPCVLLPVNVDWC